MHKVYVVTGTLTNVHTVTLDEALPLKQVKVRLVVEPLEPDSQRPYQEIISPLTGLESLKVLLYQFHKIIDSAQKRWENECWVRLLWQTKSSNKADLQHPSN